MKRYILGLATSLALGVTTELAAQAVPSLINYQGQLLAADGTPIATGDYDVEISLYPVESGGAIVWGPQTHNGQSGPGLRPKVSVIDGRFNLVLGPEDTAGRNLAEVVAVTPSLYLELKVGTGSPIAPRQALLSAPYSLNASRADNADKLDGHDWSALFAGGNPATGNMGLGVAPSGMKLDVNGRMRARQGTDGSAGIWFNQNVGGAELDRAFVGMLDNNSVGFWTHQGVGWTFWVDGVSGISSALALDTDVLYLGHATMHTSDLFGLNYMFFSSGGTYYFDGPISASAFNTTSDKRLKEHIETIEDPLETLEGIQGITFNFKEDASRTDLDPHRRRVGVLAQDVEKVLPEAVSKGPDGYLAVDYTALVPVLLEAVKEQQSQIEDLQKELESLKATRF
jgi:hypothetical protein